MRHFLALAALAAVIVANPAFAAEPLKSSLQVGEKITAIFEPLNINGEHAGELHCLVCENGTSPVAMVFAREVSDPLAKLAARLDAATAQNRVQEMGSFIVVLDEDEKTRDKLASVAKKQDLKHLILSTYEPDGPEGFEVAKEADVTVVLYREFAVLANHAFRKGELNDEAVERIVADLPKFLTKKYAAARPLASVPSPSRFVDQGEAIMRTGFLSVLVIAAGGFLGGPSAAKTPLGESLKDIDVAEHWIYDDLPRAKAEAKSSGKPLMVVLRCVPCPPGRTLDEQVMQPDRELESLEKKFVCLRIIQTNGLDLKTFQYDYDMSWAAMFLTPDGAILGRYGTRNSNGPGSDAPLTKAGFAKAAERALALFKNYPANKDLLAGKMGKDPEYAVPEKTPGLTDKPAPATTRQNCIHCHMVKEFAIRAKWEEGRLSAEDIYVYPMPERIGLTLDLDNGLLVQKVAAGSPADEAQIAVGDELVSLGGQPLISTADVQWVLHVAPHQARLPITVRRGGKLVQSTLELAGDWKKSDIAWRASSWYGLRNGVKFDPLPAEEKKRRGIGEDGLALLVKGIFGRNAGKVQQAGLRANDVIVSVDGQTKAMDESEFIVALRLDHGPKDALKLVVLRGQERKELTIPLW
jgi:hypothetical protein